jgi:hypothetical protein
MSRIPFLSFLLLAWLFFARPAEAQCQLHDGMDGGPCCGLTQAQLPNLTAFTQNFMQICWRDCGVDQTLTLKAQWNPVPTTPGVVRPCGEVLMNVKILGPGNFLFWSGQMRLQYARTWMASSTAGSVLQVWRFLMNGDLNPTFAAGAPPCRVPSCVAPNGGKARFSGYIDFAEHCGTTLPVERAWMLTHACDAIDHHAGFPRAGAFHPDRSFSFVAPIAGFVPGALQPIEGTPFSPFESIHSRQLTPAPSIVVCTFEERAVHSLTPQTQMCFCGAPGSNQFNIGSLNVSTACGTSITTPAVGPLLPGFVSMGIGFWTNPNVYPGQQSLRWNVGGYDYFDACVGTLQHDIFYGVSTIGGYPATEIVGGAPGAPLPPIFVDQANALTPTGVPRMNTPFNSSHIINLSH